MAYSAKTFIRSLAEDKTNSLTYKINFGPEIDVVSTSAIISFVGFYFLSTLFQHLNVQNDALHQYLRAVIR